MKKINIIKYIFAIFVVLLVVYAVYYVKSQEKEEIDISTENTEEESITTIRTLRVSATNVDSLNPIVSKNQNIQDVMKLVYEPMMTITEDFQLENCLAKEWINLSDTAYVIVLKEGVKWQNTENELTAEDVKFTIEQIQSMGENSIYYSNVEHIINVEAISTYNVKISIDSKIPFFEYYLTFPIMSAQYYIDDSIATSDKNNNAPGTGMYYINNITTTEIELKKNEEWRDLIKDSDEEQMLDSSTKDTEESSKKNLSLDTVLIKIYTSMGEAYNAFKMGNLDMIMTQSLNYQEYIGTLGYNVKEYIGREYDYLAFNCENNILKNKEIRQAINYAIDKSNIIASVFENNYYVTDYPINTNHFLYKTEKVSSSYNTNKSEEILQNAGWEFKNGIWQKTENYYTTKAKIDLVVNESNEKRVQVAENIKKQLEDFGITINIIKASQSQYERYLENKNYDMILTGKKIGVSPTLESYVGTNNLSNFSDQEVDEILDEIANLSDNQEEMEKKYNSLLKLIEEEQPYVSLYFDKYTLIYRQDLQGNINPNFYNVFYNIENWVRQY